jgi:hypothetical protein
MADCAMAEPPCANEAQAMIVGIAPFKILEIEMRLSL